MFKNFIKIAYRNLFRSKGFTVINITGLAIGMAATMLIVLLIRHELSYDQFHANKNRIYEVWNRVNFNGKISCWNSVSDPLGPALKNDLPEIEAMARLKLGVTNLLSAGEKKLTKTGYIADSGFLKIFSFPLLEGDVSTALRDKFSVVLTERTSKSLFGKEDALGKIIRVGDKDYVTVTGILKDPPTNTKFDFDYLLPWSYLTYGPGQDLEWGDNSTTTEILLKPNVNIAAVQAKIKNLREKYDEDSRKVDWQLFLYPLDRWHLYSSFTDGKEDGGGLIMYIRLFGIIAGFILLIACINFMNLSTARSEKRAKEVGIRKVVGAQRSALIVQFIGESALLALLAGVLALVIVELSLPAYNDLIHEKLFIDASSPYTWIAFVGFILFVGILAGSYPAFFLSSFRPGVVLKGTFKKAGALLTPRKVLVVLQFTFAILLIIGTIVIKQEIDYARDRNTGYTKDQLVYQFMTGDISKNYPLIKQALLTSGVAKAVTRTNSPLTEVWANGGGQDWEGKDANDQTQFDRFLEDEGLGVTAGLQFVQGRDLDLERYPTDSTGMVINESALKAMRFKNPIGQKVGDLGVDWHIVGVVRDFILRSPYEPIKPLIICGAKSKFMTFYTLLIKVNGATSMEKNLAQMQAIFKKYNPDYPFDPKFVDQEYARKFADEQLQGTLAALFAGLTIFISCLGLFGLATYMAESRIKEIGIRKVLGASVAGITALLSKDFVRLVIISFLIAAPIAWWGMNKWLQLYTYRVGISWWVFALAAVISVAIALLTVSYQSIKAALTNPAKNLRLE